VLSAAIVNVAALLIVAMWAGTAHRGKLFAVSLGFAVPTFIAVLISGVAVWIVPGSYCGS